MNEKFLNKQIYEQAKKEIDKQYKKHSAYKSMALIKLYKEKGGKIDEIKSKNGTKKWIKEDWRNLTPVALGVLDLSNAPKCGIKYKNMPSICRPTKRIDNSTPSLAQSYNRNQLKKALEQKKKGNAILWNKL